MADWFQAAVAAIVAIFQPIADPSATTASAAASPAEKLDDCVT